VISFANLVPGVTRTAVANGVSNGQQRINVNGNRAYSTNMQLDGAMMYMPQRGQGLLPPPPDSIQEVNVITSGMTAEYGRGTAVFSVVTKSGTNQLHGSLYDFFRNDALDARNFFDRTKAKLRYNQFGGSIGGPIIRDKLFYFGTYQGLQIRQDEFANSAFPATAAERSGNFAGLSPAPVDPLTQQAFPNGQIPTNRFDPVALKLLERVPLPNDPTGRLSAKMSAPVKGDDVVGKFDYAPREQDRISFRYYFDYQRSVTNFPVITTPSSNIPDYSPGTSSQDINAFSLSHVHTWSPNLITTTRGSLTKYVYDDGNAVRQTIEDLGATNFLNGGGPPRLPQVIVSGRWVVSPAKDQQRAGAGYDFAQDWGLMRSRHELKWGVKVQRIQYSQFTNNASAGRFVFDGSVTRNPMADFLLGRIASFTQTSLQERNGSYYIPGFYFQDGWRVSRRFTLNLGLRLEIYTPYRDISGQQATYIPGVRSTSFPTAPLGMVYASDPEYPYQTDYVNVGPRIGFAWDVFGDGKTSVRGGYAVSYDGWTADQFLPYNQPFSLTALVNNPGTLSNPYGSNANPFPYTVDPSNAVYTLPVALGLSPVGDIRAMSNQNLTLTVERQLSRDWMVQIGYVGNLARHQVNQAQYNPATYIPGRDASGAELSTARNVDTRRRFRGFAAFEALSSDANSTYHGGQLVVTKRLSHGFTINGHYTFAKGIDDSCTNEIPECAQQDPFNRRGNRAVNDHHRSHTAAFSYLYEVPFFKSAPGALRAAFSGWQLSGINTFRSGTYFSIVSGTDASLTGVGYDRANLVGDPSLPGGRSRNERINAWFNTAAFAANRPGEYGNSGRNIIRGPGDILWDLSVRKAFPIFSEARRLEFRTEMFNIMNRPNFANPSGRNVNAPASFGRITSAGPGRQIQLVLRYTF
jgi:hypothetical protein